MKVFLVYAIPAVEGAEYECVDRVFSDFEKANHYKEKVNKKSGWERVKYIEEMEVE